MDDLARIERVYGSVTEYYRSQWDDYYHECEMTEKLREHHDRNRRQLEEADSHAVYHAFSCEETKCPHYTPVGMTADDDDIPHGICDSVPQSCPKMNQ